MLCLATILEIIVYPYGRLMLEKLLFSDCFEILAAVL